MIDDLAAVTRTVAACLLLLSASGCGRDTRSRFEDGGGTPDGGTLADGSVVGPDGALNDGAPPAGDAGTPTVTCARGEGPIVVVTRAIDGSTGVATVLRLPLRFSGAASGVEVTAVRELDGTGSLLRAWSPDALDPPAGFDGRAVPRDGDPMPLLLFTAQDTPVSAELSMCDGPIASRAGSVVVEGRTAEGGPFTTTCNLGLDFGGTGPEELPLRCARGVPGWLDDARVEPVTTPIVATLVEAQVGVHALHGAALSTVASTGGTVAVTPAADGACPGDPLEWSTMGDQHLWLGMTSEDVWSGPVAAGTEAAVFWWSQTNSAFPTDGVCISPFDPPPDCNLPVTQVVLRGSSSAGDFEWESNLFTCGDA